jgi:hypothetical protein
LVCGMIKIRVTFTIDEKDKNPDSIISCFRDVLVDELSIGEDDESFAITDAVVESSLYEVA